MELITILFNVIVFAFGSAIGSFLNVVIYRIPAGLSILHPPSRCPHCLHQLGITENVPVFGWLWLQGKCKHCHSPISMRYPLIEAATGILFLFVFWTFDVNIKTLGVWAFFSWLLALSMIDLDTMTLPGKLTKSGLILGLIFQMVFLSTKGLDLTDFINQIMFGSDIISGGILGAIAGIWLIDIITILGSILLKQRAMGDGDAHLAAMMGAWLGWKYLLIAGFLACIVGLFTGIGAFIQGLRINRKIPVPFGPSLAMGSVLTIFAGEQIWNSYLQWVEIIQNFVISH
jgi:leader peptidase (prepilin peptidase) / N-methyltransferase